MYLACLWGLLAGHTARGHASRLFSSMFREQSAAQHLSIHARATNPSPPEAYLSTYLEEISMRCIYIISGRCARLRLALSGSVRSPAEPKTGQSSRLVSSSMRQPHQNRHRSPTPRSPRLYHACMLPCCPTSSISAGMHNTLQQQAKRDHPPGHHFLVILVSRPIRDLNVRLLRERGLKALPVGADVDEPPAL